MDRQSLQHNTIQNQPSWNDDPWDLKGEFAGVANIRSQRHAYSYAEELVADYAIFDGVHYNLLFSNIPEDEQGELAYLFMDSTDRDTTECVHGSHIAIDNAYTCALLSMLQDDSEDNREAFARITRKNIIVYYSKILQELIDAACNNYLHNINNEQGYYASQDTDSDETIWNKF